MRIIVLTSSTYGTASRVLPALRKNTEIDIAKVILVEGLSPDRKKTLKRKVKSFSELDCWEQLTASECVDGIQIKIQKILELLCNTLGLKLEKTSFINCETSRQLFRDADADLASGINSSMRSMRSIARLNLISLYDSRNLDDSQS